MKVNKEEKSADHPRNLSAIVHLSEQQSTVQQWLFPDRVGLAENLNEKFACGM